MKTRLTIWVLLSLLLTACRGMAVFEAPTSVPARAVEATPIPVRPTALPQSIVIEADAEELLLINLYERVNPSIVNIDVAGAVDVGEFGSGSGFVIDVEGHIVTNNHVVEDARRIYVTFADGSVAEAERVGGDPASDLAVIKIKVEAALLHPVELGDSDQVKVGQRVIAIGNPFGLMGTMTVGIVSGVGRTLPADTFSEALGQFSNPNIIQTDAAINPGNSGGPLLDSYGRVVGVNSAIRTTGENRANSGVGFAVPVNTLKRVVPQLIETGRVRYPYMGISSDYSNAFTMPELAAALDLPTAHGVLISEVLPGGPADQAGLRGGDTERDVRGVPVTAGGDIIIAIDGYPVDDFDHLISYLTARTEVGQVVKITFLRGDETLEVDLTIGERP
ncbi:MAG TPA: trypsin-like peptidase domain-containing protein [Anaerolineae bacterium]|nr:trypsin-like peptidase domain-containing protein [Anaerolineae bacterium]